MAGLILPLSLWLTFVKINYNVCLSLCSYRRLQNGRKNPIMVQRSNNIENADSAEEQRVTVEQSYQPLENHNAADKPIYCYHRPWQKNNHRLAGDHGHGSGPQCIEVLMANLLCRRCQDWFEVRAITAQEVPFSCCSTSKDMKLHTMRTDLANFTCEGILFGVSSHL